MRSGRAQLRGEAGRVAERVRIVVAAGRDDDDRAADDGGWRAANGADDDGDGADKGVLARLNSRLPVRVDPGRRPALAVAVVVVIVAVATGLWVMSSRPRSMPVSEAVPTVAGASLLVPSGATSAARSGSAARGTPSSVAAGPSGVVVVDVAGKVRRPGLYRLPPGSRIDDAITAAGGPLRGVDLTSLNLAALLVDGQQIAVGRPGAVAQAGPTAAGGPGGTSGAGGGSAGGLINLNTATLEQLEDLPGIGPALGQRILDFRTDRGSFTSVDQLDDVSGIGSVTFERLKPLVTV